MMKNNNLLSQSARTFSSPFLGGITLKDFAAQSGLSQSNLSNYINGKISPTLDTVSRIASHLGIDAIELFKEKDEVELYAKYHGKLYPITHDDLISIISKKE